MQKTTPQNPLARVCTRMLLALLLALALLPGTTVFAEAPEALDIQILQLALDTAEEAIDDGRVEALVPSAKTELLAVVEQAQDVLAQPDERQDVLNAHTRLVAALHGLGQLKADHTGLDAAIQDAAAVKEGDYTADSVQAMQAVLTKARAMTALELTTANQPDLDAMRTELDAAVLALVPRQVASGDTSNDSSASTSVPAASGSTTTTPSGGSGSGKTSGSASGAIAKTGDEAMPVAYLAAWFALGATGVFVLVRRRIKHIGG